MAYNEEYLLPFFLNHYKDIDNINLIIDADTTDRTRVIASTYSNVSISEFKFPDMMDDNIKCSVFNETYTRVQADYVILVDIDEFVFDYRQLDDLKGDLYFTKLYNVFRHESEGDLDPQKDIKSQRCHGYLDPMYIKPNIVQGGLKSITWCTGNHNCTKEGVLYDSDNNLPSFTFQGAHWSMADRFAIQRRVKDRKLRQSRANLLYGMTTQHHHITEEQVELELQKHSHDPQVFEGSK
jgi:hypothetical protein